MKRLSVMVSALAVMVGCAPAQPYDETHRGELTDEDPKVTQDQSAYDLYEFEAEEGWTITAEMRSEAFDSYLWLIGPSRTSLVQDDDGFGEGSRDSRITFTAPESGTYIVRANSYDRTGRGPYTLHIVAAPPANQAPSDE